MSKSFLVLLNPFLVQLVSDFLRDRQEFLDSHHDYDGLFGFAAAGPIGYYAGADGGQGVSRWFGNADGLEGEET